MMETHTDTVKELMVPHNTVIAPNTEKNVIKVAPRQIIFSREGIDEANVIQGKSEVL
jgi:hypothetical protein